MRLEHYQIAGIDTKYRIVDDVKHDPTLVFLGGLGGTHLIWSGLVKALRGHYRILIWDYPGLSGGETVSTEFDVDVPSLAGYFREVLKKDGAERICLVGWSLGVQVGVELAGSSDDRIEALVAITGLAGRPLIEKAKDDPILSKLSRHSSIPNALDWLSTRLDRIEALRGALRGIDKPTRWVKRLGLVDPRIDELLFDAVIRDFLSIDVTLFNRYAIASAEYDARAALARLEIPVLAVAGERDRIIKPERMKKMATGMPKAQFFEVRGATHYLPLEYADVLSLKMEEFLKENLSK